ncbi:DUF2341 domain-containing protein [Methanoculleus caldifontis]|uniref:DUF2341 domain-containing protein n=1 Tax=Methanoculleus caldifontis TaxID=2651577 RepID=UPI002936EF88|nr:DUF2341 domain-containing protein [Methanoculleus sp. Wushi-C6]
MKRALSLLVTVLMVAGASVPVVSALKPGTAASSVNVAGNLFSGTRISVAGKPGTPWKRVDSSEAPWWSTAWLYRVPVAVTGPSPADGSPHREVVLFRPGMRAEFDDLRFVTEDGTVLDHWKETYVASDSAVVRVYLPAGATSIWMYYGDAFAPGPMRVSGEGLRRPGFFSGGRLRHPAGTGPAFAYGTAQMTPSWRRLP